ncbi:MAG: stage II sporulation protein M, partial [Planctomycetia bacterium]|nr:stage II sporulation protein M [Planctomycetia bacterium]
MMNIAKLLKEREPQWKELEELTSQMSQKHFFARRDADKIARFVSLYRQVCSDLALAKSYHLPTGTIRYLNNLTGLAHHQLYRSQETRLSGLWRLFFVETPRRLVSDPIFWLAMILFWLPFGICWFRASTDHDFVRDVVGLEQIEMFEDMYSRSFDSVTSSDRISMVGFYIKHNTGIGLQCFSYGILGGIGGLFIVLSNANSRGTVFGAMIGPNV